MEIKDLDGPIIEVNDIPECLQGVLTVLRRASITSLMEAKPDNIQELIESIIPTNLGVALAICINHPEYAHALYQVIPEKYDDVANYIVETFPIEAKNG